jgi:hypothetical protein
VYAVKASDHLLPLLWLQSNPKGVLRFGMESTQ